MGYALFVLLNAVLFIRPEELWPEVEGARLYLAVMVLCLLGNLPALGRVLALRELARNPVGVCVLGMYLAAPLSNAVRGDLDAALVDLEEFGKVVLYYFLAVAVLTTRERLHNFLGWCVVLILGLTLAALLQWHEYIDVEQMRPVRQRMGLDPDSGEEMFSYRICSTGIFNDPNDLCLVLVFGSLCCVYRATGVGGGPLRLLWLTPVAPFLYTLTLTQSRGGMLGLLAGVAGFLSARYGLRRASPLLAVCLPVILFAVGGRQAGIGLEKGDTSNERVMLWAEGLRELLNRPGSILTGVGAREYPNEIGLVAHNSYVHAYVELGLFGGTAFIGAFYWCGVLLRATSGRRLLDPSLAQVRPFVVAMFVAYAVGIYTLSRNYVIPTYLLLALVTCFTRLAVPQPAAGHQVDRVWLRRTAVVGIVAIVGLKLFTQVAGHLSS